MGATERRLLWSEVAGRSKVVEAADTGLKIQEVILHQPFSLPLEEVQWVMQ
jgi:hypothetical protein